MNITADRLRGDWTKTRFVDKCVKDIMLAIQERIMDAHRESRTAITFGAPVNFNVPEMSNKDASIIIYYDILQKLQKQGFDASLEMSTSETSFIIKWCEEPDSRTMSKMLQYIASKRVDAITADVSKNSETKHERKHPFTNTKHTLVEYPPISEVLLLPTNVHNAINGMQKRSGYSSTIDTANQNDDTPPIPPMFADEQPIAKKYIDDYDGLM